MSVNRAVALRKRQQHNQYNQHQKTLRLFKKNYLFKAQPVAQGVGFHQPPPKA